MKKKILALLLALVMVFGLVACGNSSSNNSEPSNAVQDTTQDQTDVVVGSGETVAETGTPVDRDY